MCGFICLLSFWVCLFLAFSEKEQLLKGCDNGSTYWQFSIYRQLQGQVTEETKAIMEQRTGTGGDHTLYSSNWNGWH